MSLAVLSFALLFPGPTWADTAAEKKARYEQATEYAKSVGGEAVLVLEGDRVVFESYFNGYKADRPHRLASGTKSFVGVMAACAVEDGLLKWDEKVADTITEWKVDPKKSAITVRQLLTLTSGVHGGTVGRVPSYAEAVKAAKVTRAPGEAFQYGPVPFQVFGELMRRKLAEKKLSPFDYLRQRVLDPIGLKVGAWRKDADGNHHLPSGAALTAREWAKFGVFILQKGKYASKQLVAWKHLAEGLSATKTNPRYGITWWVLEKDKAVMAAGAGKQRLYVLPEQGLVVVCFAESTRFEDRAFLDRLLGKKGASR
jgi:CubicO group peptidase (beta-lactamase class C family)